MLGSLKREEIGMSVKEDCFKLKYKLSLSRMWMDDKFHINDFHYSKTTKNIMSSLFQPYSKHLNQKFYRLDDEQIKIVTDILDMMED